jgi:hypothetical protein
MQRKKNRIVHHNMAKEQEPRTFMQSLKALELLTYLGIPPYLYIFRRVK